MSASKTRVSRVFVPAYSLREMVNMLVTGVRRRFHGTTSRYLMKRRTRITRLNAMFPGSHRVG